jgi:capsular polysaccharide transport system permease protein
MNDHLEQHTSSRRFARTFGGLRGGLPVLHRNRIVGVAIMATLLAAVYWLAIASDRYVSTAHIIIQRTDLAGGQAMDFSSLIGGAISGGRSDQLLLRDHLLSVDMLNKLDGTLNLRAHYSDRNRDLLSRMWSSDESIEYFYRHYLSRVSVEFDDYAGVLIIKAQGYDPKTAHAITTSLVREGERFMNQMAHSMANDQVAFLEKQVITMNERAMQARRVVLDYQDKKGLVSPQAAAESINAVIARLGAQRSDLETQRSALQAYLVPEHPNVVQVNQQIAAIAKQLEQEQARLASPKGKTLNRTIEEFQRLEMDAAFAQDVYKTALVALEKGRVEAIRNIKKVSVLQAPTMPEYPMEPRRFYNTLVFMLIALLLAGVTHLIVAIVRDHKD